MKKALFIALFLTLVIFPSTSKAQTFSVEQQASLDAIKQTLIELLTQQIAVLQAQINDLIAKQAEASKTTNQDTENSTTFGSIEEVYDVSVTARQDLSKDYFSSPDEEGLDIRLPAIYFKIDGEHELATARIYQVDSEGNSKFVNAWHSQPTTKVSNAEIYTHTTLYTKGRNFRYEVEVYKNKGSWIESTQEWTGLPKVVKTGTFTIN